MASAGRRCAIKVLLGVLMQVASVVIRVRGTTSGGVYDVERFH
jgi:hypothetical protein